MQRGRCERPRPRRLRAASTIRADAAPELQQENRHPDQDQRHHDHRTQQKLCEPVQKLLAIGEKCFLRFGPGKDRRVLGHSNLDNGFGVRGVLWQGLASRQGVEQGGGV
jgi:hypothetical protein